MFHYHSDPLQRLADELLISLAKKIDQEKKKKLEQVKRRKSATKVGTYPGQNRSRKFKNKKREENKRRARKKPSSED